MSRAYAVARYQTVPKRLWIATQQHVTTPEILFLSDGGQAVNVVADRLLAFINGAQHSLDIALYDAFFDAPHQPGGHYITGALLDALTAAETRGVQVRAVYHDDDGPDRTPPPPPTGPSFLTRLARAVPSRGVDGRYDLMHHKYVVRDAQHDATSAVWTGSSNWTADAFTNMENVIITVPGADLAAAYTTDFQQLWNRREVEGTGRLDDLPATLSYRNAPFHVRALFSPERGRNMSALVARRIGEAKKRVHICSPVITSSPILGTLADVVHENRVDLRITVDAPQMQQAERQWERDGRSAWKLPLVHALRVSGRLAAKESNPWGRGDVHNFMHAKLVVADDWVLMGSYNLSRSGESNAENLLEIRSAALADECSAYAQGVFARYVKP
jgi:phosphatidylserine/phosphatidylglycerophosphate/cardiolipin synthase-like enzyme